MCHEPSSIIILLVIPMTKMNFNIDIVVYNADSTTLGNALQNLPNHCGLVGKE